jgi:hypothetical protein
MIIQERAMENRRRLSRPLSEGKRQVVANLQRLDEPLSVHAAQVLRS